MTLDLTVAVAGILDRFCIEDLLTGYANALDDRDWEEMLGLFTDDATFDFTAAYGIAAPKAEFITWMAGQVTREFAPHVQHHLTNRRWSIVGDVAEGSADFFNPDVLNDGEGGPFVLMNGGRYSFTARRTEDGWRLSRLAGTVTWSHRGELIVFELPET